MTLDCSIVSVTPDAKCPRSPACYTLQCSKNRDFAVFPSARVSYALPYTVEPNYRLRNVHRSMRLYVVPPPASHPASLSQRTHNNYRPSYSWFPGRLGTEWRDFRLSFPMDSTRPTVDLRKSLPDPSAVRNLASSSIASGKRHTVCTNGAPNHLRLQTPGLVLDHGASSNSLPLAASGATRPPRSSSMFLQHPPRTSSVDWTPRETSPIRVPSSPTRSPVQRPRTPASPTNTYYSSPPMPLMPTPTTPEREGLKRRTWFSRSPQRAIEEEHGPTAWIAGHSEKIPYMTFGLAAAQPVQDIWDQKGDCLVYLFPQSQNKGPSFRIESSIFQSSGILTRKAFGDIRSETSMSSVDGQDSLEAHTSRLSLGLDSIPERGRRIVSDSSTQSRSSQATSSTTSSSFTGESIFHLYLDIELNGKPAAPATRKSMENMPSDDEQQLIDIRNLFAFLTGQALVATARRPSFFSIFIRISDMLKFYEFSNLDSSTFGETATLSFENYIAELGLADVRGSRQKTVESIVLAERMRSVPLYNEAFTHCVGEHNDIERLNGELYQMITPITINRLGRAAMDLDKRISNVQHILEDFDFPSIFAGISNDGRKLVNFDLWKDSFFATRKFVLSYYKSRFGSWPPKANKHSEFETGGLNRMVLRELYHDLSAMYDLLVDRASLTNRTADGVLIDERDADAPMVRALREILSEYDRSSPPVKPPMPFDLPTLPILPANHPKAASKKLRDEEIQRIFSASYNKDSSTSLFVDAFRKFEAKAAHGCTVQQLCDQRVGQWIFMYAVLQALPMLVIDAPALQYHKGVEYFLCEPPRGGVPWARDDVKRNWYGVAGSGGMVSLPSDLLTHSIEGVFRRSHCWVMAERWSMADPALSEAMRCQEHHYEHTAARNRSPGLPAFKPRVDSRSSSPSKMDKRLSSLHFGLEAIRMPEGGHPEMPPLWPVSPAESAGTGSAGQSRPVSRHEVDTSKTFDAILASADLGRKKK